MSSSANDSVDGPGAAGTSGELKINTDAPELTPKSGPPRPFSVNSTSSYGSPR